VQTAFDGGHADLQESGGLAHAKLLEVVEKDGIAVGRRQLCDGGQNQVVGLSGLGGLVRLWGAVGKGQRIEAAPAAEQLER